MIRPSQSLAIGVALIGALTPASFGQTSGRRSEGADPGQSTAAAATVQARTAETGARAASAMSAAEKSVRATLAAYIATYNQKDAAKLAEHFTQDGTLIDSDNVATRGRDAIVQEFSEAFDDSSTYTLQGTVDRVRQITPDVAQAEGISRLVSPREPTIANQFVALLARQGDAWKIVEIRDYPAMVDSVAPHERLKELEWMVGEWVDESEDVQVRTTARWGQGKAFLVREYDVQIKGEAASGGQMIIAWDPQTQQIRSWIFNADGSRGEGSWTRAADRQWVIKAHGTTADGRPTSTTQILTLINKDAVKTSSTDRIIGGEIARDIEDVIMVRKPPAPGAEGTPAKPAAGATPAPAR